MAVPLTAILKTTGSLDKPAFSRNKSSRSISSKNNNSKQVFWRNNGNSEVDRFGDIEQGKKSRKSKCQKLAKFQKLSKSWKLKGKKSKKLSKIRNSPNFDAIKAGPNLLTFEAKTAFNYLRLAFTEASILWHFDPKCHIWIETDASGYTIGEVLSYISSRTSPNRVVTKADLS